MIGILTLQDRNKSINPFSFKQLVKSFNLTLIVQFILAIVLLSFAGYLNNKLYAEGNGTDLTDIFMSTAMTYTIVGTFFYLPSIVVLNLALFLYSKLRAK
ncbi:MAG: hypothetical protein H3C39_01700 [Flavobacteriia bacterium]|nr:hypothetical protein [Flavobacteriia bacterium]